MRSQAHQTQHSANRNMPKNQLICTYYEQIFANETALEADNCIWEHLFRLKPNRIHFETSVGDVTKLSAATIDLFCTKCIAQLDPAANRTRFETINALYNYYMMAMQLARATLAVNDTNALKFYVNSAAKQSYLNEVTATLANYLHGTGDRKEYMETRLVLHIFHVFALNYDYLNDNPIYEAFMTNCVFEKLLDLLFSNMELTSADTNILLTLVILTLTYRTNENTKHNEIQTKFAQVINSEAFEPIIEHLRSSMTNYCSRFEPFATQQSSFWFGSLLTALFAIENTDDLESGGRAPNTIDTQSIELIVLAVYYWCTQNERFTATLPNLVGLFLRFLSILMARVSDEPRILLSVKLAFLIVRIWCENAIFCEFMFAATSLTTVRLFRVPLQHRRLATDYGEQPLVVVLLDLIDEFVQTHLMKKLPLELYSYCLRILHRIVHYKKSHPQCRPLPSYANNWNRLVDGLLNLMKFLVQNDSEVLRKSNIFAVASQIVNIFNMFIDGGAHVFDSIDSFNRFLYEIVRRKKIFLDFHTTAELYQTVNSDGGGEYEASVRKLLNSLRILMEIVRRIGPKIDQFVVQNNGSCTISEPFLILIRDCWSEIRNECIETAAGTGSVFSDCERFNRYGAVRAKNNDFFIILARNLIGDRLSTVMDADQALDAAVMDFLTIFPK